MMKCAPHMCGVILHNCGKPPEGAAAIRQGCKPLHTVDPHKTSPEGAAEYTLLSPLRGYRFIYIRKQGFRFRFTPAYLLSPLWGLFARF